MRSISAFAPLQNKRRVTFYSPSRSFVGQTVQQRTVSKRVITIGIPGRDGNNPNIVIPTVGYNHSQPTISSVWVIVHNLGYKPNCQAFTQGGDIIHVKVNHIDNNITELRMNPAQRGYARLV